MVTIWGYIWQMYANNILFVKLQRRRSVLISSLVSSLQRCSNMHLSDPCVFYVAFGDQVQD